MSFGFVCESILKRNIRTNVYSETASIATRIFFSTKSSNLELVHDSTLLDDADAPPNFARSAQVYPNAVTVNEEESILQDVKALMKRRRYERGHWDSVIVQYKEIELNEEDGSLSDASKHVLMRLRDLLADVYFQRDKAEKENNLSPYLEWLPCHAIQLSAEGELKAHVDSVRFSGDLVAGLSLNSSSIMRLRPAPPSEIENEETPSTEPTLQGHIDLLLQPRSLYALYGSSRYLYTHELLEDNAVFRPTNMPVRREDRFSIIFRDAKRQT